MEPDQRQLLSRCDHVNFRAQQSRLDGLARLCCRARNRLGANLPAKGHDEAALSDAIPKRNRIAQPELPKPQQSRATAATTAPTADIIRHHRRHRLAWHGGRCQWVKNGTSPPTRQCKIEVTGSGDASLLKPGMLVRFSADVDKKTGKASPPSAKSKSLLLKTPWPPSTLAAKPAGSHTALKKARPAAAPDLPPIVGTIKAISGNEITVEAPGGPVKADLSPTASVKVESSDPTAWPKSAPRSKCKATRQSRRTWSPPRRSGSRWPARATRTSGPKPGEKPAAATN